MKKMIFLGISCLSILLLLDLPNIARAEVTSFSVTRTVQKTEGGFIATTRLQLERIQRSEIFRFSNDLKFLTQNLIDRARNYVDTFKAQTYNKLSQRSRISESIRASQEKAKELTEKQKEQRYLQQSRLKDMQVMSRTLAEARKNQLAR
jgi:hypothetical protein